MTTQQYTSIDAGFPIIGKDNSALGFQQNFTAIKNSFEEMNGVNTQPLIDQFGTVTVYMNGADYQLIPITTDITIQTEGLVINTYCKARLEIRNDGTTACAIQFNGTVFSSGTLPISLDVGKTIVIDVWSSDNGDKLFVNSLGVFQ